MEHETALKLKDLILQAKELTKVIIELQQKRNDLLSNAQTILAMKMTLLQKQEVNV